MLCPFSNSEKINFFIMMKHLHHHLKSDRKGTTILLNYQLFYKKIITKFKKNPVLGEFVTY